MSYRISLLLAWMVLGVVGCGESKTVIPTTPFTDAEIKAIEEHDKKVADEESHGAKRR